MLVNVGKLMSHTSTETKALLHEGIYNELVPQVEPLSEEGEPIVYPYPLLDNQMVEALLETSEWSNIDE